MTNKIPTISESEWEVLKVLWQKAPRTANEIISSLPAETSWKPKTVRTLLDRLTNKEVIGVHKDQRVYTFYPLFSQNECQRAKTESFVKRFYDGTLKSMLVQFIQDEDLSEDDIKELRSILDNRENKE
ncbi:BlaI family transcriptional regulator, penicillinase repressor [Gracilibacillus orientalis]|uniref:BlaI family transcriptional regulator, penicillinase repressor n=1 Tax=Gracilibacillus orientalis TaxID=334253 RepID=A0A1I4K0E7_9BACI|nr:penicillinase repressor BlaI [Gracilibacillus orientalis]SFL72031.1 BlaI family transcriptional regulator, penicillinase repressor [Gracilibacillus orientalis]